MDTDDSLQRNLEPDVWPWLLFRTLRRRALTVGLVALAAGVAGIAISFLVQPQFTASVILLPRQTSGDPGLLANLGSFANIRLPGEPNLESLYPVILRSDRILDGISRESWRYREQRRTLPAIFGLEKASGTDSLQTARRLKKQLRERVIGFEQDKQTGVMRLSATVPRDPIFAADFANALTDSLGSFLVAFNSAKTAEKLLYAQRRLNEVRLELQAAGDQRTRFLEENRALVGSPRLMQTAEELERQVMALSGVWVELVKQLEIAKLDNNQERFSLEILDRAQPPLRRSRPHRAGMGLIGLILGGGAAAIYVLARAVYADGGHAS